MPGTSSTAAMEDPDQEFASPQDAPEPAPVDGPRIINVGLGVGRDAARWRRAWRDKIMPALLNFSPDLILVSAGFDAHRHDDINMRYIGLQERDFEWVTDQVVQVHDSRDLLAVIHHHLLFINSEGFFFRGFGHHSADGAVTAALCVVDVQVGPLTSSPGQRMLTFMMAWRVALYLSVPSACSPWHKALIG